MLVFIFKQKTAYEMRISDWSSDVCSSDLRARRTPCLHDCAQLRTIVAARDVAGKARVVRQLGPPDQVRPAAKDRRTDDLGDDPAVAGAKQVGRSRAIGPIADRLALDAVERMVGGQRVGHGERGAEPRPRQDRKSTRMNYST